MLHDSYLEGLVADYFARGGEIHHYPYGLSGFVIRKKVLANIRRSRAGWVKRHGVSRVPDDSVPFIRRGELCIDAARAPIIWLAIQNMPGGAGSIAEIADQLKLSRERVRCVMLLLRETGRIRRTRVGGRNAYVAIGVAPSWRDYLGLDLQRAAA